MLKYSYNFYIIDTTGHERNPCFEVIALKWKISFAQFQDDRN